MITIGEFVKMERQRTGKSIRDISKTSGVSTSTISETENNVHTPKIKTLVKILGAITE